MKIALLLSGGVDSSVALSLLRARASADITAFYLKIWLEDELAYLGNCPWEEDLTYARAVCELLGVRLEIVPLQREYFDRVVTYALAELKEGRTPSPDIFCNQRIKFGIFYDHIADRYEKIATGHYARVEELGGRYHLFRAPDPVKDQTYFLSHLRQEQVARALFPIGSMKKSEVRELAFAQNLPNKARPDSQGICFLGKIKYPDFVRHYLGERSGEIIDRETGRVLGEHRGFWFHTIGQRQGLGLGNGPWYVVAKDVARNRVYVSHGARPDARHQRVLTVTSPSWIGDAPGEGPYSIKLRHGAELHDCSITYLDGERIRIVMDTPDDGIAPGQFAVFYSGEECLGGARIESSAPVTPEPAELALGG